MLERRYECSQAPAPGQAITNLFPSPDLSVNGPYGLCAKCHDLNNVVTDASFQPTTATGKGGHATHISLGVSCSACHTAHGMGAQSATIAGERLVNFDANVVGPLGTSPISYNRLTNTCALSCHGYNHNSDGTVTLAP
jgi:hypothetical protein